MIPLYEIFETVLMLSIFGFAVISLLLAFKPITSKKLPARWQYCVWIAVLILMIVPVYKLIPQGQAQKISAVSALPKAVEPKIPPTETVENTPGDTNTPAEHKEPYFTPNVPIRLSAVTSYIWFGGVCVFLIFVAASYTAYISKMKKNSAEISENEIFENAKRELGIKRKVKIRVSANTDSPLLVGVFFPTVYIPCRKIPEERLKMVFLHELTHYMRKDLLVKWISVFINAVHWFNPLVYLLCANLSEACEVSCDMAVTKNMTEEERTLYMKTILLLAEHNEKGENHA